MRTKEVEDAIKLTYKNLNQDKNELIRVIEYKRGDTMREYLEKEIKRSETLLAYISELEKENQKQRGQLNSAFDNGFIHKDKIRDKIKELEEVIRITEEQLKYEENTDVRIRYRTTIEQATAGIFVLKELLGE